MTLLPEHSHCKYCGNPIPYGMEYCDDDCKSLFDAQEAQDKKKDIIFYGAIAVSLIAIIIVGVTLRTFL